MISKRTNRFLLKAFTLLELMIVVAIIGILTAVGTIAYTTIQQKGRDARRVEDMKAYQNAQEQYYVENSFYDTQGDCSVLAYLPSPVSDPGSYTYDCSANEFSYGYCMCAQLDDSNKGNSDGISCDCGSGVTCRFKTVGTGYYCVSNLQ